MIMFRTSQTLVMQSLINLADNKFVKNDCIKDEARILLAFFTFRNLIRVDYLTSGTKKALNFLQHAFTQVSILQHFDPKRQI